MPEIQPGFSRQAELRKLEFLVLDNLTCVGV